MLLIDKKDLLCSRQNYIQYHVVSCNGKSLKMENVCVCV